MTIRLIWTSGILALSALIFGCGGSEESSESSTQPTGGGDGMLAELESVGLFEHLGAYTPSMETPVGDTTEYWFDVTPEGPQCFRGGRYGVSTRDQGSDNLLIYLMGGGACWTGFDACTETVDSVAIPPMGGLNAADPTNPMRDWNHAYVPYCDGSIFIGDRKVASDRIHFGLRNLSAALDVIKADFPSPARIMLAGSSAGGFGTIWATGIVRKLYPDAELMVFNDAGVGVAKSEDPEFRRMLEREWGAEGKMPPSCTECQTSPHTTPLITWGIERDQGITLSMFSSYADDVIAGVFLGYGSNTAPFTEALLTETDKVHAAAPDRVKRFFIEGGQHTALGGWETTTKDGMTLKTWATGMVDGDAAVWMDMP